MHGQCLDSKSYRILSGYLESSLLTWNPSPEGIKFKKMLVTSINKYNNNKKIVYIILGTLYLFRLQNTSGVVRQVGHILLDSVLQQIWWS